MIAGVISGAAFGFIVLFGIGAAMSAGAGGGSRWTIPLVIMLWLGGLLTTGFLIFKK